MLEVHWERGKYVNNCTKMKYSQTFDQGAMSCHLQYWLEKFVPSCAALLQSMMK